MQGVLEPTHLCCANQQGFPSPIAHDKRHDPNQKSALVMLHGDGELGIVIVSFKVPPMIEVIRRFSKRIKDAIECFWI